MKRAIILVFASGVASMFGTDALACGPHGGGKSKSSGGGVGIGGGVSINLSGIGHRQREADPFAVGGGSQPVARTQKKPQTTRKPRDPATNKPREPSTTSDFANVELTGEKAKGEIEPPRPLNVSSENEEMQTVVMRKGEVSTTTPKTTGSPKEQLEAAKDACRKARTEYLEQQPTWKKLTHDLAAGTNTEENSKKALAAYKEMQRLIDQFNANEGKKFVADWKLAYDNAVKADQNTDDYIPPP